MNKKELQQEIEQLIQSIKLHYHRIDEELRIPTIELELITAKIRKLYEKSILFNHLHYLEEQGFITVNQSQFEKNTQNVSPQTLELPKAAQAIESKVEKTAETIHVSQPEAVMQLPEEANVAVAIEHHKTEIAPPEPIQEPVLIDKKDSTEKSVTIESSQTPASIEALNREKEVITKQAVSNQQALKDLNSFISLNNKYMFMSKLFWGNADEYRNSITQMNQCNSVEESKQLLQSMSEKYKWQKDSEAVEEFTLCVLNRFK